MTYKEKNKLHAIISLYGYDLFSSANEHGEIEWKDGHTTTDAEKDEIEVELIRLKALDAYQQPRREEYPSIEECVHAILDDDLTALQEKRQAVKTKYPKP